MVGVAKARRKQDLFSIICAYVIMPVDNEGRGGRVGRSKKTYNFVGCVVDSVWNNSGLRML
jgi:hypothetical protein